MKIYLELFLIINLALSIESYYNQNNHTSPEINIVEYKHEHPQGLWMEKTQWKAHWVKHWETKKIWVEVWRKVWGPVHMKEWVPFPKPPPNWETPHQ